MKALFYTREYPPYVSGGAGVHVEYLAKEMAQLMKVDVRCFGDQDSETNQLKVRELPFENSIFDNSDPKLKSVFKTLATCIHMNAEMWMQRLYIVTHGILSLQEL
jgi:hypothetical protein